MILKTYKIFEYNKTIIDKKDVSDISKKYNYVIKEFNILKDSLGLEVKIEFKGNGDGHNEYDNLIKNIIKEFKVNILEVYTEETGNHFKIFLKDI